MNDGHDWIAAEDAIIALGIDTAELSRLIHAGTLEGDGTRVTAESFEAYIASRLPGPTGEPPATCYTSAAVAAAGAAAAAGLPPLSQDQADTAAALLTAHQQRQQDGEQAAGGDAVA